jgi:two-component system sensor histidine kinase FlrB
VTSLQQTPNGQLENAFQVFSQVSEQLVDSYHSLQIKVKQLNQELSAVHYERLQQSVEQERLTHRLHQLVAALPAAVIVLDSAERIEQFNPAAKRLFSSIHGGQHWPALWQQCLHEKQGEDFLLTSDRLVSLIERPLSPDPGRILLLLDITQTRELQQRLERQQRLGAMGEMSARLAHQIRTPLASALLYTSHLSRDDLTSSQRARFSGHCLARLRHMERQINDMLIFARGGQFQTEAVDLSALLTELVQTLEPALGERSTRLQVQDTSDGKALVYGNRDALLGALINLANNALEHGREGGVLKIRLCPGQQEWELDFSDEGPGIPEHLRARIFDPFFTTRSDGTGLGLSVVQSVALAHRGRIGVRPRAQGGSCFSLVLPVADNSGHSQVDADAQSNESQQSAFIGSSA